MGEGVLGVAAVKARTLEVFGRYYQEGEGRIKSLLIGMLLLLLLLLHALQLLLMLYVCRCYC